MKKQVLIFLLLLFNVNLFSQSALEKHFLNRWNEYRTSISLNPVSCQFQHWKVGIAYKDYDVLVYSINEKKDTIYKKEMCRGNKKYIPKFHDKNTSKILEAKHLTLFDTITESPICNIIKTEEDYFKCMDYMDSVRANILFKELLQSKENEIILSSNYNFYLNISFNYSRSDSCIVYNVQLFEIIENTDLSISSDYDSFILNGNFQKLRPFIVDEFTKKRKYKD